MAITNKQKEERKRFLGSSDISALFTDDEGKSLDPFKTAVDVWASKVYDKEEKGNGDTKPKSRGRRYESALIEFAKEELGGIIVTHPDEVRFICEEHPIFACNLDGILVHNSNGDDNEIVEAKTTGLTGEWGEPGTDDVPFRVNLQVHQQMLCTGWNIAHIAVLLGRWGLTEEMYVIERNEDIINAIIERGEQFWNDYVLTKKPPADSELGRIDSFKYIKRVPEKYADMDMKLIIDWELNKQERLDAEKREKAAFVELLTQLGDAEGVHLNDGREFTYFKQTSNRVDTKRFKAEYPDIYNIVLKESSHRVARIRKVK
ncbi:MAG TPA: hypothetical protein ENH82_06755 [bacterium]|nr:hypothetical protein [bacterium]